MLVMAGIGLTYALQTVQKRRDHDKAIPRKARRPWLTDKDLPPTGEASAPADLAGLGYLPTSTGFVATLHVEELLASPAGKEFRSRPMEIGNIPFQLDTVREWTGVEVENIEHVVLGVVVRDGADADLTPPVHLIVRTRRAYQSERVRVALKASKPHEDRTPEGGKRTIYSANVRNLPVKLWLANETTIVVGLFSNLEQVPSKPFEGLSQLSAELRQVIEKRIDAGLPMWAAGHSANWKKTWLPTLTSRMKEVPMLTRLEDVRTFALWLIPTNPAKVAGAFRCASEEIASKIEQKELEPRANGETFKYNRQGEWLEVQMIVGGEKR
jgi:hypothetical protein